MTPFMPNASLRYRTNPAPLDLCLCEGFDRTEDKRLCPPERTALSEFYVASKGAEWTESKNWTSQYTDHCLWYGVKCANGTVVELNLTSNGLSGTLSHKIEALTSLTVLDLSDNEIKVSVRSETNHCGCFSFL